MVKKERGQDDYFNQQTILLTLLPAYISATHSEDLARQVCAVQNTSNCSAVAACAVL